MNISYDVRRTQQALQYLVDSPYGMRHITKLKAMVDKPRALPFREECEPLNELLVIGRQNRDALEKLIDVVQYKRSSRGSYQREFMATKRARERKVIQLECLLRGKNLTLDERNLVLKQYYETWRSMKEEMIATREPASWAEKNELIAEFWAEVDAGLDKKLARAREQEQRTATRRHVVHAAWQNPKTVLGQKLAEKLQTLPGTHRLHLDRRQ